MTPDNAWEELVDFVKEGFNASPAVVEGFSEAILAADLRIKRLEEELEDIKSGFRNVVNGLCAGDEKHCACVYPLRARIKELEEAVEWALQRGTWAHVDHPPSDREWEYYVSELRRRAGR
jgi:archaellum component FlaC